jgi:hypothetical protein
VRLSSDFARKVPSVFESLKRRAFNNSTDVLESVERSKEEIDDLMAANPFQAREKLGFKDALCGTVSGFRFPFFDWSLV